MAGKFTVSGTDTTITFTYTAPTAQIQAIVNDAAQYYWNIGMGNHGTQEEPILFTSLTNQQKLNLLDQQTKQVHLDAANTQKSVKAQETARVAEEATKHTL